MKPVSRPKPGKKVTRELRFNVCSTCGFVIQTGGMCDYQCPNDVDWLADREYVVAVYERTDVFLRDEPKPKEKKVKK